MCRKDAIQIEGAVVEALSNRLYRVELANGHRLLAHLPRGGSGGASSSPERQKTEDAPGAMFGAGDKVTVEMSPFDFSKGRIQLSKR